GRGTRQYSRKQSPGIRLWQGKGFVMDTPAASAEKRPQDEKRRVNQDRDKRNRKDMIYEEEEKTALKNKAGRFIKPEKKETVAEEQIKVIVLPEKLTIKELADKMKMQPSVIIKKLFLAGQIVTLNTEVSYEEAENIAIEYEIMCEKEVQVDVIEELLKEDEEDAAKMVKRPPVVCVMGHVDHGKTSLLDAIRKTNVTDREAGGITQAIGAYTVNINNSKITFLDTPGHEAFTAMRMRGANATDIAILVVAADDGVMPQTVEAINHAKAAGVEIIVAVNKIDKPAANVERVKQELMEYELVPTDWGGSTEFVQVSAKSRDGVEDLLETILLTAEILELKANKKRRARGLVIEAELDKGRGPVATILVQKGTLKIGDFVSAGASYGKVRAMIDDKGKRVKEAGPSMPVEILGLSDVPTAGEVFLAHENDKTAKNYAETYLSQHKEQMLADTRVRMSLDDLFSQIKEGDLKELNLVVKADVQGSVEAVKQSLLKLSNEEVVVKCIHGGVGAINESDVSLASASNAIIIGFNVKPDVQAKATAEREKVDVRLYDVIYKAIEDVEHAMKGMLAPVYEEKVIGHAEVRQIFKASAVGNIAGSYVLDGEFKRDCKIRITREGEQIYEGKLASLKRFKDDVKEVRAGYECGLVFEDYDQMKELDIVEAYIMVEVPRE
ncbi:MAG: translation initiation factor IF-2, partial [Lachnospiraceae bacterium]|nr:translation initiation factor IF-2 [Lachnospiraceae bacterium]